MAWLMAEGRISTSIRDLVSETENVAALHVCDDVYLIIYVIVWGGQHPRGCLKKHFGDFWSGTAAKKWEYGSEQMDVKCLSS